MTRSALAVATLAALFASAWSLSGPVACDLAAAAVDGGPEAAAVPDGAIRVIGGGTPCLPDGSVSDQCPGLGLACCGGSCVNTANDPNHCGACGTTCAGLASMCHESVCAAPTCQPTCATGLLCCDLPGSAPSAPRCAVGSSCPVSCPPCG